MSLLLDALKALADRPVPADGAGESATSEKGGSKLPEAVAPATLPSQEGQTDLRDRTSEQLLESAASAVAESLHDEQPIDVVPSQATRQLAESDAPAADEPVTKWAEIWQQALQPLEEAETTNPESSTEADDSNDETPVGNDSAVDEKLESIFAPWFAAHGLANEPADSAELHATSQEAENDPSQVNESIEPPVPEIKAEYAETPAISETDSTPAAYSSEVSEEQPVDPTWELYDRSVESLAAWGFQQAAPGDHKNTDEPTVENLSIHSQIPVEYVPDQSPKQRIEEAPAESRTITDQVTPPVSEQPCPTQLAEEKPKQKVRRPNSEPYPATKPLAVSAALAAVLPSAQTIEEIRVSEPYLRLASRLLQSLRTTRPQAIILASADEASARTLDMAQLAKAITLSEEGKLLFIQGQPGRPDLTRRLGINPDQHPRWQGPGSELYERIYCSSHGPIDLLPQENLVAGTLQTVDPLLVARCKRQYPLVLVDVGVAASEIARGLAPQGDAALLVAVMQNTPRELAVQANALLRRLGVRTAGCVLMEPRPANSATRKFLS